MSKLRKTKLILKLRNVGLKLAGRPKTRAERLDMNMRTSLRAWTRNGSQS